MQIIKLQGHENITVIRHLLEQAADSELLLFVPRGCEALENNKVNLIVLRRWADNLALRIGLVIENRDTRILAREVGFVVFPSIAEGQKTGLRVLDHKAHYRKRLPQKPALSPKELISHPISISKGHRQRNIQRAYVTLLIATGVSLALLFTLLLVLPSATVTLMPITEPVEAEAELTGVAGLTNVNFDSVEVPARIVYIEQEGTETIATTGRRDVPDGHAQGTVVFANKTTIPVTITKGTVVRTSFGENVRFYTVADAWLPGELYATVRVGILATEPGPRGNVPPLSINVIEGELAAQVDVLNDSQTSGGTVRRIAIVDSEDKSRLRAKLITRLQEKAYNELIAALAPSEFIPPDSLVIAILSEEFDHNIGDMTDELALTMKVKVSGLAVSGADGEKLLLHLLEQRIKPGYRLLMDSTHFERGAVIYATPEQARFSMRVEAAIAPAIDAKAISRAIAGKTIDAAMQYLSRQFQLSAEPQIKVSGNLGGRLPWWAARIRVRVVTR